MKRLCLLVLTSFMLSALSGMACAATPAALPPSLELHYVLRFGGLIVGRTTQTLIREKDGTYRHRSRSRPEGMARLFTTVEWFEEGRFEVIDGKVRPLSFLEYRVGADKPHRHSVEFDWKTQQIRYAHGGVLRLPPDTQSQGSLIYALMLDPPTPGVQEDIHLSGGKKLERYRYILAGTETLKTPLGSLQTRVVERLPLEKDKDQEEFRMWLASGRSNLPIRIATVKRGEETVLELESATGL